MINAWGITDKGVVRTQNQDGYYLDVPSEHLAVGVVCDGMGGLAKGRPNEKDLEKARAFYRGLRTR